MAEGRRYLFSSEQVNSGHPDKLCDYVSDSILDAALELDPNARVAVETCAKNNGISIIGEISCQGDLNFEKIIRKAAREIGYDSVEKGLNYANCQVIINIDYQSAEIMKAVGEVKEENIGAGDQGIMFGYATDEDESYLPMSYVMATRLLQKYDECRRNGTLTWARPDAKSQVTLEYEETEKGLKVLSVHTIVMSVQHGPEVTQEQLKKDLQEHVISKVLPEHLKGDHIIYFLNPSGSFIMGGPTGDAGLTGRKIIADTYGGWGSHGGGCFSGKDGSKVDRSGAYAARRIAKSLVANKMCHRCIVQLAYGIGIPDPISVYVNSFGTAKDCGWDDVRLDEVVRENFNMKAGALIKELELKKPQFKNTTCYGHFFKTGEGFKWEQVVDLSHVKK